MDVKVLLVNEGFGGFSFEFLVDLTYDICCLSLVGIVLAWLQQILQQVEVD